MEHGVRRGHRRRAGFFATALWVLPLMVGFAAGGFFLARDFFSPKFLAPAKVQEGKRQPIRILSPEEAARVSRDQSSHVWTEGVRDSDIPALEPETPVRRHTRRTRPSTEPTESAPAVTTPTPAAGAATPPQPEVDVPDAADIPDANSDTPPPPPAPNLGTPQ